jgi:hypothetical protein
MFLKAHCTHCGASSILLSDRAAQPIFCWECSQIFVARAPVPIDLMAERRLMANLNLLLRSNVDLVEGEPPYYVRNPIVGSNLPESQRPLSKQFP